MNAFNLTGTRYACKRRRNGHAAHVGKRMYVCTCMPKIRTSPVATLRGAAHQLEST